MAKQSEPTITDTAAKLLTDRIQFYLDNPEEHATAKSAIEALIGSSTLRNIDDVLQTTRLSYRDALLIILAFKYVNPDLNTTVRPAGSRTVGSRLGRFLKAKAIPFVNDAFQNIGKNNDALARGNYEEFDDLLGWFKDQRSQMILACLNYGCSVVAAKSRPICPMPELDIENLTFARMMGLYEDLLNKPSQGAYEQFVIASLLAAYHGFQDSQYRVQTKHLTASDRSSGTAGDIQILDHNRLIEAYEITANDWRSKLDGVDAKAREHDLTRSHIVTTTMENYSGITRDLNLPTDISLLDLRHFAAVLIHFLPRAYRKVALYRLHDYLSRYQESVERVNIFVDLLGNHGLALNAPKNTH